MTLLTRKCEVLMDYQECLEGMLDSGLALGRFCSGELDGDESTNFLSPQCIECPYLAKAPVIKEE